MESIYGMDPADALQLAPGSYVVVSWYDNGERFAGARVTKADVGGRLDLRLVQHGEALVLTAREGYRAGVFHHFINRAGVVYSVTTPNAKETASIQRQEQRESIPVPHASASTEKGKTVASNTRQRFVPTDEQPFRASSAQSKLFALLRDGRPHKMTELYALAEKLDVTAQTVYAAVRTLVERRIVTMVGAINKKGIAQLSSAGKSAPKPRVTVRTKVKAGRVKPKPAPKKRGVVKAKRTGSAKRTKPAPRAGKQVKHRKEKRKR